MFGGWGGGEFFNCVVFVAAFTVSVYDISPFNVVGDYDVQKNIILMIFSIFTSLLYIVTFFCYLCLIYLSFTGVSMLFTIVSYLRY